MTASEWPTKRLPATTAFIHGLLEHGVLDEHSFSLILLGVDATTVRIWCGRILLFLISSDMA